RDLHLSIRRQRQMCIRDSLWIPLAGGIFGVYQLYLYVVGGRFVHDVSLERSALAMFLSILLVIVFVVLVSLSGFV
ncbi:YIP1 family protein, partial [Methanosarcina sp. 1.H.T.1A.1]|uniref:YIP1 family protein n=1 Tax=Methanosarcina sp. 1.H.T.1A.1 TaxID=1483602 RepID=UPI002E162C66